MNWTILYYSERVKKEVFSLPSDIYADYRRLIGLMEQFGADLRLPHSRALGNGLFELRPRGREGIARVLYCTAIGKNIVILHSFVKKTEQIPRREMEKALQRLKEVRNG